MSYIYGKIPPARNVHRSPVMVSQLLGSYQGIVLSKVSTFATKHNLKIVASVANTGLKYRKKVSLETIGLLTPTGVMPIIPKKNVNLPGASSTKYGARLN
jgi:hypothetical protein